MLKPLKLAVLFSSFAASAAVLAQSTPPSQAPGANAPSPRPTQVAQGQPAGTAAGAQSSGVAATTTGATAAGTGFAVPAAVAVGMSAVGAAAVSEAAGNVTPTATHH
jgi:hypothetical protein